MCTTNTDDSIRSGNLHTDALPAWFGAERPSPRPNPSRIFTHQPPRFDRVMQRRAHVGTHPRLRLGSVNPPPAVAS